jgi:hypothetical protein
VIVRKPEKTNGTIARKPLQKAVDEAITDGGHATRLLFQLGNAAQIFFAERVLLNEGKTEQVILPLLYETYFGRTHWGDKTGIVQVDGSGNFRNAMTVLNAMGIFGKVVADLDYAFTKGVKAFPALAPNMASVKTILTRLSANHGVPLDAGGLPTTDRTWKAARGWALFAQDAEGSKIVLEQHEKLKASGVWIWREGTIEDVLGLVDKGEEVLYLTEQNLRSLSATDLRANYPSVAVFWDWFVN